VCEMKEGEREGLLRGRLASKNFYLEICVFSLDICIEY